MHSHIVLFYLRPLCAVDHTAPRFEERLMCTASVRHVARFPQTLHKDAGN